MKKQQIVICLLAEAFVLPFTSSLVTRRLLADSAKNASAVAETVSAESASSVAEDETEDVDRNAQDDIEIDKEHFPDQLFRQYVKRFDKNEDGFLSKSERYYVSEIAFYETELDIESVKGVEYFPALRSLVCTDCMLSELDISKNTKLTFLSCDLNHIEELDLSKNTELQEVYCSGNILTKLDVSMLPDLYTLDCSHNSIQELDLSKNTNLQRLYCSGNKYTELDLSMLSDLLTLDCSYCLFNSLDLSCHPLLEELFAREMNISDLDTHPCPNLVNLDVSGIKAPSLDLSGNPKLESLNISGTGIAELDLSCTPQLRTLICSDCVFDHLDLDPVNLEALDCSSCMIRSLDLSKQTNLRLLIAFYNKLTELDLTHNTELESCNINYNDLSELDISHCPNLGSLDIRFCLFKEPPAIHNRKMVLEFEPQRYVGKVEGLAVESTNRLPVKLSWEDVKEAEAFQVFRSDSEYGEYVEIGQPKDLTYEDKTALAGKVYYYKVRGYRTMKEYYSGKFPGEFSEVVKVDTTGWSEAPENSSFAGFVERLYTMALNRESDPEGKEYWIKQVMEQGKTGADCARFFLLGSDEFLSRKLTTEKFVEILYNTFFDRAPDEEGKKGWVEAINSGRKTKADVVNDFIESTEWCDVCASYGVKSGAQWHKATKPSENARRFATRLYTCCLKREAEEDGLQYWALALTNLEKTGASAAQFFFEGEEFVGLKTSDQEYVTRLYTTFMDREPSEKEVGYWINELTGGKNTRQSILAFFAQSPEFTKICKQYGIERGQL